MKSLAGFVLTAIVLSAVAFMLGSYQTDVYRKLLLWVTLALSYNFLFGIAGQIAFSHFTFYGIGAYAIVILLFQVGLPLPLAVLAGIALCVVLALVVAIPATRLEGFYLALATLAFAQLFIVVLNEGGKVTGAAGGLANYRLPDVFGVRVTGPWYTVVVVLLLLTTLATLWRLDRSWSPGQLRVRVVHRHPRSLPASFRRQNSRPSGMATPWVARFRVRSDVPRRWVRSNLRRDGV